MSSTTWGGCSNPSDGFDDARFCVNVSAQRDLPQGVFVSTSGPPSAPPPSPTGPPPPVNETAKQAQLVRSGANWFIWIAGLSLVNSVLFVAGSNWAFFLGLGATQFSDAFGKEIITGTTGEVVALIVDVVIAAIFVGLGLMSRNGALWSFNVGMVLIILDALLLVWVQDWAAVAFHALALFFIIRGFQAARQLGALRTAAALPAGTVPPITPR